MGTTIRRRTATVLAWAGAVVSPVLLDLSVVNSIAGPGAGDLLPGVSTRYLLPVIALLLPFPLLRTRPLPALFFLLLGSSSVILTIHIAGGYLADIRHLQLAAVDLAVGYVAATRSRQVSVPIALGVLVIQILVEYAGPPLRPGSPFLAVLPVLAMVTAWVVGNSFRARRIYAEQLQAQAAAQATTAERLRIARELHDMVAHSIGIIAMQAGMGHRVIETQPAAAKAALSTIETTSRETLAGLRRLLSGLRHAEPDDPLSLGPAPDLSALEELAIKTGFAGVRVEVRRLGEPRPLPADLELSAFRLVQEAVTNVVRHSGAPECLVTLDYGDADLKLDISDEGRGCEIPGAGFGIAGMRERTALLNGALEAGPRPGGGFQVRATLPIPADRGSTDPKDADGTKDEDRPEVRDPAHGAAGVDGGTAPEGTADGGTVDGGAGVAGAQREAR